MRNEKFLLELKNYLECNSQYFFTEQRRAATVFRACNSLNGVSALCIQSLDSASTVSLVDVLKNL